MKRPLTVLIGCVLVVVACGVSSARQESAAGGGVESEYWMGLIATGQDSIPEMTFVVTLRRASPEAPWTGTLDIPRASGTTGAIGVRLKDVVYTPTQIKFMTPPPPAENSFELARAPDGQTASGVLLIAKMRQVLIKMWRASEAEAQSAITHRPQNPPAGGPLPYTEREVTVKAADGTVLAGTLAMPGTGGTGGGAPARCGALLLLSDRGAQDRDGSMGTHKPLLVWADQLARRGIATLRLDDRGAGGSGGAYDNATMDDLASDAIAAVDFLKTQPAVDAQRVGVLGMGEGATVAAKVSAGFGLSSPVKIVVLLAPAALRGDALLALSERRKMEATGEQPSFVARRTQTMGKALALVVAGSDEGAILEAIMADVRTYAQNGRAGGRLADSQVEEIVAQRYTALTTPHMRSFLADDPASALAGLRCDMLALLAEHDLVAPAPENMLALSAALDKAVEKGAVGEGVSSIVPGINHWMQPGTGFEDEYDQVDVTVAPEVLKAVLDWVAGKLGQPR